MPDESAEAKARSALARGDAEMARTILELALEAEPSAVGPRLSLACVYAERGETGAAIEHLQAVLTAAPAHAEAASLAALLMARAGRPNPAILAVRRAMDMGASAGALHDVVGTVYFHLGLFFETHNEFQIASSMDPGLADAYEGLQPELFSAGRYEDALAQFESALAERRADAKMHTDIGRLLAARGCHEGALAELRAALEIDPANWRALRQTADSLSALGRWPEAVPEYEKLLKRRPRSASTHACLGAAYDRNGFWDLAVEHYREASAFDSAYGPAHFVLAQALDVATRHEEALVAYIRHARARGEGAPLTATARDRATAIVGVEFQNEWDPLSPPPVGSEIGPLSAKWSPGEDELRAAWVLWSVLREPGAADAVAAPEQGASDEPAPAETETPAPVASEPGKVRILRPDEGRASAPPDDDGGRRLQIRHGDGSMMAGGAQTRRAGIPPDEAREAPGGDDAPSVRILRSPPAGARPEPAAAEGAEGEASKFKIVRQPNLNPYRAGEPAEPEKKDSESGEGGKGFKIVRKVAYFDKAKDEKEKP